MLLYRGIFRFDLKGAYPVKLPILVRESPIICEVRCDQRPTTWQQAGTIDQVSMVPAIGFVKLGKSFSLEFAKQELPIDPRPSKLIFTPVPWLKRKTDIFIYSLKYVYGKPVKINCGGASFDDLLEDSFFSGGSTYVYSLLNLANPQKPTGYENLQIFGDERSGASFSYSIPLSKFSLYRVRLFFNESAFTSSGSRIFNVAINGVMELQNFDIFSEAGKDKVIYKDFNILANQINIEFQSVLDGAQINAIEIVEVG